MTLESKVLFNRLFNWRSKPGGNLKMGGSQRSTLRMKNAFVPLFLCCLIHAVLRLLSTLRSTATKDGRLLRQGFRVFRVFRGSKLNCPLLCFAASFALLCSR